MQPLKLVESYSTAPGTPGRAALLQALSTEATEDSDVLFILYAVAEAGTARGATARGSGGRAEPEPTRIELGEGFVNLETLLKEGDVRCDPSPHAASSTHYAPGKGRSKAPNPLFPTVPPSSYGKTY